MKAKAEQHRALAREAAACVLAGETCLDHCFRRLAAGDKAMGACAEAVRDMIAVCQAVTSLAANQSRHVATAAKLCEAACKTCEAACKPHVKHHAECAACAEACVKAITAARAFA